MPTLIFFPYMEKTTEHLRNRIREWRQRRGKTLVQLAHDIGTRHGQVQKMEVGDRPVTIEWLERIAKALDVTVGELLNKRQNPYLADERERALLAHARAGGEQVMRTMEAVAEAQRAFNAAPPESPANDEHDVA